MRNYIISYILMDKQIKERPKLLHDSDWIKPYLQKQNESDGKKREHAHLVMMCQYHSRCPEYNHCPQCHNPIMDDDWKYCPDCGCELNRDIDLFAKDEIEIMQEYLAETGEPMPADEQQKIERSIFLKIWIKKDDKDNC